MESEKLFLINPGRDATHVNVRSALGRILHRPEVSELARSYGSSVMRLGDYSNIEIVPPIPASDLGKFGEALVSIAKTIDPAPPKPDYRIV